MVLVSLRRAHIRVEYSVSWLAAAAVFLLFALIPGLLDVASRWMGLSYPPTALVILMVILCSGDNLGDKNATEDPAARYRRMGEGSRKRCVVDTLPRRWEAEAREGWPQERRDRAVSTAQV